MPLPISLPVTDPHVPAPPGAQDHDHGDGHDHDHAHGDGHAHGHSHDHFHELSKDNLYS